MFFFRNFLLLHKLKKEDDLTSASYLHMQDLCQHLLSQTNYNRGRQLLSVETWFICLFQNCVYAKLSSTLFPFTNQNH